MTFAIHFINSLGIFHRDLKPENFLINMNKDGKLYLNLNDLGIAKNVNSINQSEISTTTGAFSGSIVFCLPERIEGKKDAFIKEDIWALGVITYYMCTYELPFNGGSQVSSIY